MTRFKTMLVVLLVMVLAAMAGIFLLWQQPSTPLNLSTSSLFTIEKGSSAHRVLKQLEQQGALPHLRRCLGLQIFLSTVNWVDENES